MCQRPEFDRPKPASSRPVLGATVCAAFLALGLPTCVALGVLPDPAVGWAAKPSTASVATAAIVLFGALCIVELLSAHGRAPLPAERAVYWLEGALAAAPEEPRLLALLGRAQGLATQGHAR